ncbi:radical SAM protein, partial [Candidatus Woesearchaeota archaeon]|nr:radical SAM protein [Candidatus Woesearchaeota archaeon]
MRVHKHKKFKNGTVYALKLKDGNLIETTDTYLPHYTINAVGRRSNSLIDPTFGDRSDRWMVGISTMSGCPVGCKFCATGKKFYRNLTAEEMAQQVEFVVNKNKKFDPQKAKEFKILFTRMGEPALNKDEVNKAIKNIKRKYPKAVIALSTIGVNNSALADWSELSKKYGNIQLQFSIHSTSQAARQRLIPYNKKLNFKKIKEAGKKWMSIKNNCRKIGLNFTLLKGEEFSIKKLEKFFPKEQFFIKLSPLNKNRITIQN